MDPSVPIKDFWYDLPPERIAQYPLTQRDQSRLLVYKNGVIQHNLFTRIPELLPTQSTLFFNDTRVIPARLFFQKETGATIEIFLLNPIAPSTIVQLAMETTGTTQWQCTIGNLKRWPEKKILINTTSNLTIQTSLVNRELSIVEFSWQPATKTFAEVISQIGVTPLPPYLNRNVEPGDQNTYQTVYSLHEGAVAAPTAGLHFTAKMMDELKSAGHSIEFLTLHVSAGTFLPVKVDNAADHTMHKEQIIITRKNIEALLSAKSITAIGTTSLRTLESLYWYGVKLMNRSEATFQIFQEDPYRLPSHYTKQQALERVLKIMEARAIDQLIGDTSIYIMPGYSFRLVDALITNFHQPGSTLILLVAAFTGPDWRNIYEQALKNNYRFLSYGDSSLLFKNYRNS